MDSETLKPGTWEWAKAKVFLGNMLVRKSWKTTYGYSHIVERSPTGETQKICMDCKWYGQIQHERYFLTVEEAEATDWIVIHPRAGAWKIIFRVPAGDVWPEDDGLDILER